MKKLAAEKVKGQTMGLLCRLFGKSWQAYYQHRDTLAKERMREEMVLQYVSAAYTSVLKFHHINEVRHVMAKAVDFYNNERPHMSLDNMTPRQAAEVKGQISKRWTSFRENHLRNLEIQKGATSFAPQTLKMIEELKTEPVQLMAGLRNDVQPNLGIRHNVLNLEQG